MSTVQTKIRRSSVPAELRERDRWVLWRLEDRDGQQTKVPYCARSPHRRADSTDRQTWASFEEACSALDQADGIGFVLGDGVLGIDLDSCVDDGELHPDADDVVSKCSSYAEWSPSGNGVHVLALGKVPTGRNRGRGPWGGSFEVYDRDRFFTFTGERVEGTPKAVTNGHQKQIDEVCQVVFASADDEVFLRRLRKKSKFRALFDDGDTDDYESRSEADLALCSYLTSVTRDAATIGRLFRKSALMREKWEREDYRERTISRALRDPLPDEEDAVAEELRRLRVRDEAHRRYRAERDRSRFELPEPTRTLADDLAEPRSEVKYAIDRLHLEGGNSLLVAQFKTGKTTLLLNLARSLADGEQFLDEFDVYPLTGRVAFLNYEMGADALRGWMDEMAFAHPERVAAPLHLRGQRLPFWDDDYRARLAEHLATADTEWLIVDPAQRAWTGFVESSNDNDQISAFTDLLDELKREAGIPNLVLSTHMGRERFAEGEERSRGATRLEDWADAIWYLTKDRTGRRALRALGRDVDLEALDLDYDGRERSMYASGLTRVERRSQDGVRAAVEALSTLLNAGERPKTGDLEKAIQGDANQRNRWIQEAEADGLIRREKDGKARICDLTDRGREFLKTVDFT